jgi:hypothetical protein
MKDNPYIVPPFEAPKSDSKPTYTWWSWHPCYPRWSKSCWDASNVNEAMQIVHHLRDYHNKLILELNGQLVELLDVPCKRLELWREHAIDQKGWRRPTDAQPIPNWQTT